MNKLLVGFVSIALIGIIIVGVIYSGGNISNMNMPNNTTQSSNKPVVTNQLNPFNKWQEKLNLIA